MLIIELLKALIFGVVEGITEWLPVSSTGHLILVQEFINFSGQDKAFLDVFNVVIQLGAIMAVVVVYFKRLNPFQPGKTKLEMTETFQLWLKVVIAIIPVMIAGLLWDDWFEAHFYNFVSVALMLILYGFIFIWIENRQKGVKPKITSLSELSYQTALFIGLFQLLSLMPGTSRSGATIIGGLLLGTSRAVVTEFTFFLGIPVMFGASLLKIVKFIKDGHHFVVDQLLILSFAMIVAFVVSLFAIRFLTNFVKKHDFKIFGYYRIVLGLLLLIYYAFSIFLA
ncbi:undecaprenyl-diphosphate phosphatase [Streptococcus porcorum]|uniref:Undecaprenyl-diphosphatase n=1 Tax=Streptococcus porcorum TaxID=701526 RepID=A0ABV2JFL6_9STRE